MQENTRVKNFILEEYKKYTKRDLSYTLKMVEATYPYYQFKDDIIEYSNDSSLLMAIYHLISYEMKVSFCRFNHFSYDQITLEKERKYECSFKRSGNVIEVIDDVDYLKKLIDWMGKNGLNELFFTFQVWDAVKDVLREDLLNRGIFVTLGGHSLKYLLKENELNIDEFTFLDNKGLIELIRNEYLEPIVRRISLWPEDVGIKEGEGSSFFKDYISFTKSLQEAIPEVEVEHIAYNAGLSKDMLEHSVHHDTSLNTLYAYWGRDYSKDIRTLENDVKQSLVDWNSTANELCVFEYYSDFYLMSELYGPLTHRIQSDISYYKQKEVSGIINLIVPLLESKTSEMIRETYNWKWIHMYNNYIYAQSIWNMNIVESQKEWFSEYNDNADFFIKLYNDLEKHTSHFTMYNAILFNKRFVDDIYSYSEATLHLNSIIKLICDSITYHKEDSEFTKETQRYLLDLVDVCRYFLLKGDYYREN